MANVIAYHPVTGHTAMVDAQALDHHLRGAGWMTRDEWAELEASQAARTAELAKAGADAPAGTTENEGE